MDQSKSGASSNSSEKLNDDLLSKKQERKRFIRWVVGWALVLGWFFGGVIIGCYIEGWTIVTSCYVMVQIITTIGYGDVTVDKQSMKLVMTFYVLLGVMIVAGMVSNVVGELIIRQNQLVRARIEAMEMTMKGVSSKKVASKYGAINSLFVKLFGFLFWVGAGTIFYALYEPCSCSYGTTLIEGCVEGAKCVETGGATKSWNDSFYMSVITLTTVGFGDFSPKSSIGRIVGCFWMLLGVASTALFLGAFSDVFLAVKKDNENQKLERIDREMFDKIDTDKSGELDILEFRHFAFLKFGLVSEDDLRRVDALFDAFDLDNSGDVDYREVAQYMKLS